MVSRSRTPRRARISSQHRRHQLLCSRARRPALPAERRARGCGKEGGIDAWRACRARDQSPPPASLIEITEVNERNIAKPGEGWMPGWMVGCALRICLPPWEQWRDAEMDLDVASFVRPYTECSGGGSEIILRAAGLDRLEGDSGAPSRAMKGN